MSDSTPARTGEASVDLDLLNVASDHINKVGGDPHLAQSLKMLYVALASRSPETDSLKAALDETQRKLDTVRDAAFHWLASRSSAPTEGWQPTVVLEHIRNGHIATTRNGNLECSCGVVFSALSVPSPAQDADKTTKEI